MIIEACPKCGTPLMHMVVTTIPPFDIWECHNCGWRFEKQERIVRTTPPEVKEDGT